MTMLEIPSFGSLLKRHRIAAGLTQEALAERAGLSTRAISDLERGINRYPRQDTVGLLADALALPPPLRAAFQSAGRPAQEALAGESAVDAPHNLPVPPTPLVGRERELQTILALLRTTELRLLTLC